MKFCHIAPSELVPLAAGLSDCYLTLAHLIERDEVYRNNQREAAIISEETNKDVVRIMDNSGFEFYKEHGPGYVFDPSKLIDLAKIVKAEYIVLPDYPGEQAQKTMDSAIEHSKAFKDNEFGTFFVPQSRPGEIDEYIDCFDWAVSNPDIDYIGVSILGVPIAFDVEANNKLNRFNSRWWMMNLLADRGILQRAYAKGKRIHFLGMVDGPNEIYLCNDFWSYIDSWDTSSAIWAAIEGKRYDKSPTGLINGKIETPVDFSYSMSKMNASVLNDIMYNCNYINVAAARAARIKQRGDIWRS